VSGIVGGERPQIDTINSDDGKQAASSPDRLSSHDPNQPDDPPDWPPHCRHSTARTTLCKRGSD
jgi:hypothetical protein